jgi:type I restriction enzyme S subunit
MKPLYTGLRNTISKDNFFSFKTFVPPIEEQTAIANFLDDKTTKIDQAIAIKQKQIELLKERRQILINKVVTRGLNDTVKLRDSGVEWIGEIPEHWTVSIAKHILIKLERPKKKNGNTVICSNHGYSKLLGDVNQGLVSLTQHDYQGVNEGDLLVHGMDAWHGAISISKHTGDCTSVVHVCDSNQNKSYIAYFLKMLAIMNVYKVISDGVRQNTSDFRSWKKFGDIQLLIPPKDEQNAIVAFLDSVINKIATAISLKEQEIEKLKEYKMSLIDGVVTGKVKVC